YWSKATLEGRLPAGAPSRAVTPAPSRPHAFIVREPPIWSTGDSWRFVSTSTAGDRRTYTWRDDREETVEGVTYYVLKSGTAERFYRKSDLADSHENRQNAVATRNTPPRLTTSGRCRSAPAGSRGIVTSAPRTSRRTTRAIRQPWRPKKS